MSTGFAKDNRSDSVKLHCTAINTRYRSKDDPEEYEKNGTQWTRRESFDATAILEVSEYFSCIVNNEFLEYYTFI